MTAPNTASRPGSTATFPSGPDPVDVLLVCTTGGHLLQLAALRPAWAGFDAAWVTHEVSDAESILRDERVYYAYFPTTRNVRNLLRNCLLAWRIVRRTRPKAMITTGAALAVPFSWAARLQGVEVVYIESFSRIEKPSLTCRLVRRAASRVYVQWADLEPRVRGSRYVGSVFSS